MAVRYRIPQPAELLPLFIAPLVVMLSTVIAYHAWANFHRRTDQLDVTRQVMNNINGLLSSLKDAETGQRGFIITGAEPYLDPYRQALKEIPRILVVLSRLEGTRAIDQVQRIEMLRLLTNAKLEELQQIIEIRRKQGLEASIAVVRTDGGKAVMDQMRKLGDEIVSVSDARLKQETAAAQESMNSLGLVSIAGSGGLFAFLALSTITIRRATRRRQALIESLQESQGLLASFVRLLPFGVAMLDREMRYLHVSDRWCRDYQLDSANIRGRSHYEIFPDIPQRWKEIHRRGLAGDTVRAEEDFFERVDGRSQWLRWEVRPWGDRNGNSEGILIFAEDITQRKEMEETFRKQRDRLDKILATTPGAVCTFRLGPDGSTSLPYSSPGFQKMVPELPDLQKDAAPLFTMMHSGDAERVRASILESARNLTPWRGSYRLLTTRGVTWIEGYSLPERETDGSVYWYGFATDITERKRMDEALHEKDVFTTALFDTAAQGIVGVDADGKIRFVNEMTQRIFGYERTELVGQTVEILLPVTLREKHLEHRASFAAMPANRPMGVGLDLQGRRKDGSVFPIEVSLTCLATANGPLTIGFLTDITVRKQAELALRKSEHELRELAGDLLTAQEDERRRIARDLHDDVTQTLGLLASEIDQMLIDLPPAQEAHRVLRSLLNRVHRILGRVREISHGLHPAIIEDLGLGVALRELFDEFSEVHAIAVRFDSLIDPHELTAELSVGHASCLYRIAQECLQNATKHAFATEIRVTLKKIGEYMELVFRDDGAGLSPDYGETGLGIVSMKERVRALNGTLAINSRQGQGTEIRALVPIGG